jgi:serine/threonine-protein kinase
MADEQKPKQRLEIGHVLFIDIVDYSKLLTDEQSEALHELNQIVRNTEAARDAEAAGELTILPTGDGMALIFTGSIEAPVECALEISHALRAQPSLPVRMGIHSGPVHHVKDANGRENIAGVGINIAQRVMDCGDAGHILVSKRVADDLAQQRRWQPYLHELGDVEVKHGVVVSLVNFYAETIGNPTPPGRIGKGRGGVRAFSKGARKGLSPVARAIFIIAGLLIALIFALAMVSVIFAPAIVRSLRKNQVTSTPQVPAIPSPPSFADTIKGQVAKKIADELQDALTRKKNAAAERQEAISRKKEAAAESSLAGSAVPEKSIAVLPFVNMSADKNDEYLSDGMTEELINVLAKVPGLRVPGRTSCFAFKGKNEEDIFRKVGDQLHVGTVLEGSVRKAGDKLRVTAQLINVSDGYHLWSKDYDGDVKDILNFQSNVAEQVVHALQLKLGVDEKQALAKRPTENPEAHRLYLLGRYEFAKYTQAGWNNAIRYYEQALKLDPNYALAYCGLADNYAYMGSVVMPENEAIAKEKEFAQKALALDPDLAEAHMSLALALVAGYDWRSGLKEFDRALELNPNLAFAYEVQAWTLNGLGRFDEAIAKVKKAVELDPLNPFFQMSLSFYQYWAGQYDEAIAQARKTLEMDPNSAITHVLLGLSFLKQDDTAAAIAEFQKAKAPNPGAWYQGYLGYAYAISGELAKAQQALHELEELAKRQYVSPSAFATIYLGLGEKEKSLDWLEKAYEQRDSACWYLKIDQIYDSLRDDRRFEALVEKIFGETE